MHPAVRRIQKDPWWHVLGLCLGLAFALVLMIARLYPQYFNRIDALAESVIRPLQTFGPAEPFLILTVLGSGVGVITIALGFAYFIRRNRFAALQLLLLLVWSSVSMGIAKSFVERTRPSALDWLVPLHTYSFPSGHATLSAALYGFISVQLYRRSKTTLQRFLSVFIPVLLIFLVCLSRVVLGYHYFTDVAAGVLLGCFWLAVVFMLPNKNRAHALGGKGQ